MEKKIIIVSRVSGFYSFLVNSAQEKGVYGERGGRGGGVGA